MSDRAVFIKMSENITVFELSENITVFEIYKWGSKNKKFFLT